MVAMVARRRTDIFIQSIADQTLDRGLTSSSICLIPSGLDFAIFSLPGPKRAKLSLRTERLAAFLFNQPLVWLDLNHRCQVFLHALKLIFNLSDFLSQARALVIEIDQIAAANNSVGPITAVARPFGPFSFERYSAAPMRPKRANKAACSRQKPSPHPDRKNHFDFLPGAQFISLRRFLTARMTPIRKIICFSVLASIRRAYLV